MIKSLYVELDSLFDTRLSFLNIFTKDKLIPKINYHNRKKDNFGIIPKPIFDYYYSFRNKSILKNALPTLVFDMIIDIITNYIKTNESVNNFKLYINSYPYKLDHGEIYNFKTSLRKTFLETDVDILYFDPYDLDMSWLSGNVDILIMYDGIKWLEYKNIIGELREYPMTDKTLIVPMRLDGINIQKDINDKDLMLLSLMYKTVIGLEIVDLKTFNARVAE